MKKKLFSTGLIAVLCLGAALTMTACGQDLPYSDYDLSEYVTVGEYKGLEYEKTKVSVSKEDVQKEIDSRLKSHATSEQVTEGTVEDGDTLNIDYKGTMDGKKFDGGSAEGASLTIGSGSFIEGFESGLVGKEIGSSVTLDLTFPEDYGKDSEGNVVDEEKNKLAGKPVTFEVKINSKTATKTPEYNMDFVKEFYSDYDSLEAFEKSVKEDLLKKKQEEADASMKQALWQKIVDDSKVKDYPEELLNERIEKELKNQKSTAESYGMEWEAYLEAIGYTEDSIKDEIKTYAETILLNEMVMYSIAEKEDIVATDDEYNDYLLDLLEGAGMDEESFKTANNVTIQEWAEERDLRTTYQLNKVMDKVIEYGTEKK